MPALTRAALGIPMALPNLLRRTVARLALEAIGMLAARRLDAGVGVRVAVALANLFRRTFVRCALEFLRLLTTRSLDTGVFRDFTAAPAGAGKPPPG